MIKVKVVKKNIKVEAYRIGLPGSVWRNGTGVPANSLGIDRDYYLENVTGNVYARTAGVYTLQTNITGPAGINTWGSITGSLSNQTDLVNALAAKYDASNPAGYITSSALAGYATQTYVNSQGFITASALSPYGLLANPLSQFAATTSAQLAGIISDETGSGALVFGTSPTFTTNITTPNILGTGGALTITAKTTLTDEMYLGVGGSYGIWSWNGGGVILRSGSSAVNFTIGTPAYTTNIVSYDATGNVVVGGLGDNTIDTFQTKIIGVPILNIRATSGSTTPTINLLPYSANKSTINFRNTANTATRGFIDLNESSGEMRFAGGTGGYFPTIYSNGSMVANFGINATLFSQNVAGTGAITPFTFTAPNNTNQTLSTNIPKVLYTLGSTQWATGALATQKFFEITAPTISFVGTSTATNVYTMYVSAPVAGSFASVTNSFGFGTDGNIQAPKIQSASGNFTIEAVSGNTLFRSYGNQVALIGINTSNFTPVARSSGAGSIFAFAPPANTNQTASAEIFGLVYSAGTQQWATGNITTQREVYIAPRTYSFVSTSTIANAFGLYAAAPIAGTFAIITNNYAAGFAGNVLLATNNKAIYGMDSAGTARKLLEFTTGDNINIYGRQGTSDIVIDPTSTLKYFIHKSNGSVGIYGVASPTANLHIGAGAAGSSKAPLKFTSGTIMTAAEVGACEYNNTFHLTNSDAVRRHIVLAPTGTKVTAAAPYANDGYVIMNIGGTDIKVMTTA